MKKKVLATSVLPFEWRERTEWQNKLNTIVKAAHFTLICTTGSLNPFPLHSHFKYHTNNARRYPVGAFLASFFHSQPSELRQNQTEYLFNTAHSCTPGPLQLIPTPNATPTITEVTLYLSFWPPFSITTFNPPCN